MNYTENVGFRKVLFRGQASHVAIHTTHNTGEPEPLTASRRSQLCLRIVPVEIRFSCRHAENNSKRKEKNRCVTNRFVVNVFLTCSPKVQLYKYSRNK